MDMGQTASLFRAGEIEPARFHLFPNAHLKSDLESVPAPVRHSRRCSLPDG